MKKINELEQETKRDYSAKECAEFMKSMAHIFDAYEDYAHYSTESDRKENVIQLLEVIKEYKKRVPQKIRKYLDNSDELTLNFEGINGLEKEVKNLK